MGHGSRRRVNWPRTLKKLLLQLLIAISAGRRTEINIIFMYHGHREGRKAALLCADGHYAKIYQTWWSLLLSWLNVLNRGRSLRDTISSSSNSFNSISLRGTKNWMITDLIFQASVSNIYSKQIQRFFRELQFNIFLSISFNSISASFISSTLSSSSSIPELKASLVPISSRGWDQQSELRLWSLESDRVKSRSDQKVNAPQLLWRSRGMVKETGR